jgi:protein TonB
MVPATRYSLKRLVHVGALPPPLPDPLEDPLEEPLPDPLEDPLEEPLPDPLPDPLDEPLDEADPLDEPLDEADPPLDEPLDEADPLDEAVPLDEPLDPPPFAPPSSGELEPAAGVTEALPPKGPPSGTSLGELHPMPKAGPPIAASPARAANANGATNPRLRKMVTSRSSAGDHREMADATVRFRIPRGSVVNHARSGWETQSRFR